MLRLILSFCLLTSLLLHGHAFAAGSLEYFLKYAGYNTNHLVADKKFQTVTERFFGKREDAYLTSKPQRSSKTLIDALHGPPDNIRVLQNRYLAASACRASSCDEKALVVMDTESGDIAYALVHYSMDWSRKTEDQYQQQGILTVFFREGVSALFKDFVQVRVKEWQASFKDGPYQGITALIPATLYLK